MLLYMQVLSRQADSSKARQSQAQLQQLVAQNLTIHKPAVIVPQLTAHEDLIELESTQLLLRVGVTSAVVHEIVLKNFTTISTKEPLEFGRTYPVLAVGLGQGLQSWKLSQRSSAAATWTQDDEAGVSRQLTVELAPQSPTFSVELRGENHSLQPASLQARVVSSWGRSDASSGRGSILETVILTKKQQPWQRLYLRYFSGTSPRIVPRGTLLLTQAERYFCQAVKPQEAATATILAAPEPGKTTAASLESALEAKPGELARTRFDVYVGPRDFFKLRDAGFAEAFPIGILGRIGLVLMLFLKGIASLTHNYGVAIVLLSLTVTLVLSPFTMMSVRSMKKMQELQPKLQHLKNKHKSDPQRMNKESFALFREHRVSPLGGCLPLLLSLPIFFAIWSAISHVIELRGEHFLWIKDLSLPDKLATLPFGMELNILPVIMAGAMFLQTKISQGNMPQADSNPTARAMSGPMMPVLFGFMFYQLPSGLVLYWLMNSLATIAVYRIAKT